MSEGSEIQGDEGRSGPSSEEVRRIFLDFFAGRDHRVMASSSLVPAEDPTLLFTNAGMNQFKDVFLGLREEPAPRVATVQKCMRVSGKHNDLENVGPSTSHHTFFEMLGNFSFGDYFKDLAIELAWELMVDVYGLPVERLWASVYEEDDEAFEIWEREIGLAGDRLVRLGAAENYWSMGETGPCGPCSEIHWDWGEEAGCGEPDCGPACECGRFVELWNLVFMQFDRDADGTTRPLPSPNIDTGAGLERLTAVLQGRRSNYDTDLFQPVIAAVGELAGVAYGEDGEVDVALRVVADHGRALAFLLADGVMPANEGRGYVLRRLVRRAMRFGMRLGLQEPFVHRAAGRVVEEMAPVYPELEEASELVARVVESEEERFLETLSAGRSVFLEVVSEVEEEDGGDEIPGEAAFRLYDTYGLPLEMTREMAAARDLAIDDEGFRRAMEAQRRRARAAREGGEEAMDADRIRELLSELGEEATTFVGYEELCVDDARVLALLREGEPVESLGEGESGGMLVDRTPFYAEAGGQVPDRGAVEGDGLHARLEDVQRPAPGLVHHRIVVEEGELRTGDTVILRVDEVHRRRVMRNHTATHLLHAALRERFGEHVRQAGSLVAPDRLRFDFTHFEPLDDDDVASLEDEVNEAVRTDLPVESDVLEYREAIDRGALAFFGEKYGDVVRVITVPGVSMELCGGTHVERTGQIGSFLIHREESVAAGTRRIEAVTGDAAVDLLQRYRELVRRSAGRLRSPEDQLPEQIDRLQARVKEAEREVDRLRLRLATGEAGGEDGDGERREVDGITVVTREVEALDANGLRNLADVLKNRIGSGVVVVGTRSDGKASVVAAVTADLVDRVAADDLVRRLAELVGGGGGGHAELAQAGGPEADRLGELLERAPEILSDMLG